MSENILEKIIKKKIEVDISDEKFINFFNKQKIDFWKVLSIDFYNINLINYI